MPRYMLDTDICIFLIKQKSPRILERLLAIEPGGVVISSVTWFELKYGVERSERKEQNREALDRFILPIDILQFDERAADQAARVRAGLVEKGTPIGSYDVMIGGHALAEGLTLVTNNEREFSRVPNLIVENWTA